MLVVSLSLERDSQHGEKTAVGGPVPRGLVVVRLEEGQLLRAVDRLEPDARHAGPGRRGGEGDATAVRGPDGPKFGSVTPKTSFRRCRRPRRRIQISDLFLDALIDGGGDLPLVGREPEPHEVSGGRRNRGPCRTDRTSRAARGRRSAAVTDRLLRRGEGKEARPVRRPENARLDHDGLALSAPRSGSKRCATRASSRDVQKSPRRVLGIPTTRRGAADSHGRRARRPGSRWISPAPPPRLVAV